MADAEHVVKRTVELLHKTVNEKVHDEQLRRAILIRLDAVNDAVAELLKETRKTRDSLAAAKGHVKDLELAVAATPSHHHHQQHHGTPPKKDVPHGPGPRPAMVDIEAYLTVRGTGFFARWKRMFVMLSGRSLYFAKGATDQACVSSYSVAGALVGPAESSRIHAFFIRKEASVHLIQAPSHSEMRRWVDILVKRGGCVEAPETSLAGEMPHDTPLLAEDQAEEARPEDAQIFGSRLPTLLQREGGRVPRVVSECLTYLEGGSRLDTVGLFREPGATPTVEGLRKAYESSGTLDLEGMSADVASVASLVKLYLREMPEPVMTFQFYHPCINLAARGQLEDHRVVPLLRSLPVCNAALLSHLLLSFERVVAHSHINGMSSVALAIVVGPAILRGEGVTAQEELLASRHVSTFVQFLIERASVLIAAFGFAGAGPNTRVVSINLPGDAQPVDGGAGTLGPATQPAGSAANSRRNSGTYGPNAAQPTLIVPEVDDGEPSVLDNLPAAPYPNNALTTRDAPSALTIARNEALTQVDAAVRDLEEVMKRIEDAATNAELIDLGLVLRDAKRVVARVDPLEDLLPEKERRAFTEQRQQMGKLAEGTLREQENTDVGNMQPALRTAAHEVGLYLDIRRGVVTAAPSLAALQAARAGPAAIRVALAPAVSQENEQAPPLHRAHRARTANPPQRAPQSFRERLARRRAATSRKLFLENPSGALPESRRLGRSDRGAANAGYSEGDALGDVPTHVRQSSTSLVYRPSLLESTDLAHPAFGLRSVLRRADDTSSNPSSGVRRHVRMNSACSDVPEGESGVGGSRGGESGSGAEGGAGASVTDGLLQLPGQKHRRNDSMSSNGSLRATFPAGATTLADFAVVTDSANAAQKDEAGAKDGVPPSGAGQPHARPQSPGRGGRPPSGRNSRDPSPGSAAGGRGASGHGSGDDHKVASARPHVEEREPSPLNSSSDGSSTVLPTKVSHRPGAVALPPLHAGIQAIQQQQQHQQQHQHPQRHPNERHTPGRVYDPDLFHRPLSPPERLMSPREIPWPVAASNTATGTTADPNDIRRASVSSLGSLSDASSMFSPRLGRSPPTVYSPEFYFAPSSPAGRQMQEEGFPYAGPLSPSSSSYPLSPPHAHHQGNASPLAAHLARRLSPSRTHSLPHLPHTHSTGGHAPHSPLNAGSRAHPAPSIQQSHSLQSLNARHPPTPPAIPPRPGSTRFSPGAPAGSSAPAHPHGESGHIVSERSMADLLANFPQAVGVARSDGVVYEY